MIRLIENVLVAAVLAPIFGLVLYFVLSIMAPDFNTDAFFDFRSNTSKAMSVGTFVVAYMTVLAWRAGKGAG